MVEFSEKNFVQEILKAFHKFLKEYFEDVNIIFKINKLPIKTYMLNFDNVRIDIKMKRLKAAEDSLYWIRLNAPKHYQININDSVFQPDKFSEIVRIGYENGLRTGELLKIIKYFAETCVLTIIMRLKSNYGLAEENYNVKISKLIYQLEDSPFMRDRIKKLVDFLKTIGHPSFKDLTDIETVRLGLIQGLALKNFNIEVIGDIDSLRRILKQWFGILQESQTAELSEQAYYMIYDFRSLILENELIKAVSRIIGRITPETEIKKILLQPSLIRLYKIFIKKDPPLKNSYTKISTQLNEFQLKKLLKELRYMKIQERKYNRLIMIKDLTAELTDDEEINHYINQLHNFNRLKYDEIVNKTVEYALAKNIIRNIIL